MNAVDRAALQRVEALRMPYDKVAGWWGAGLLLLAVGVVYAPTLASMVAVWAGSETFTHGFLIVPISLWLGWRNRDRLEAVRPQRDPLALIPLVGLVGMWLLGRLADVQAVQQLAVVAMVPICIWLAVGWPTVRALAFPLAYLFFAVPIGDFLVPSLMQFTADFSVWCLERSGVPLLKEGMLIRIPGGDFEVAEACSGVRFLIASVALGSLYAYLMYRSTVKRLVFISASAVVPIIANGLRAYAMIMLAHVSDMRIAVGFDHIVYGWLFFGAVILLMFWAGFYFRDPRGSSVRLARAPAAARAPAGGPIVLPGAALLLVLSGPLSAGTLTEFRDSRAAAAMPALPRASTPWLGPHPAPDPLRSEFVGAAVEHTAVYEDPGDVVWLHTATYREQHHGKELIQSRNRIYDPLRWNSLGRGRMRVALSDGGQMSINSRRLQGGSTDMLVVWWYELAGRPIASPQMAKLWQAWSTLFGRMGAASVVVVSTRLPDGGVAEQRARLADFVARHGGSIRGCLARAAANDQSDQQCVLP